MFKNFMKITLRNLARHPGFSLINILGLAVGLAGCGFIFLFVTHETGFDRSWPDADRIYRVAEEIKSETSTRQFAQISFPFAPAVKAGFPAVETAARMMNLGPRLVENGDKKFYEEGIFCADPEIFAVFGFPLDGGKSNRRAPPSRHGRDLESRRSEIFRAWSGPGQDAHFQRTTNRDHGRLRPASGRLPLEVRLACVDGNSQAGLGSGNGQLAQHHGRHVREAASRERTPRPSSGR